MAASLRDGGRTDASADFQNLLRHNVRLDRIEYIPVDLLKMHDSKLRKRSAKATSVLKNSLTSFGIMLPILSDRHNIVIGCESIVEAARSLCYRDVPTVHIDHLDANEVRLVRIALNKLGEQSEWNMIELAGSIKPNAPTPDRAAVNASFIDLG